MSIIPTRTVHSGVGLPRIIREIPSTDSDWFFTTGTPTYTATTCVDTVALDAKVRVGRRIRAVKNNTGFAGTISYGKITAIDAGTRTITVDSWIGGTPTATNKYAIDGYIADLPRAEKIVETFTPDALVHNLWRSKKSTKLYGYNYAVDVLYENWISPDDLYNLRECFRFQLEGSNDNIIFIPHVDKWGINYNVYLANPLIFSLTPDMKGHKGFKISFIAKQNVCRPPQLNFGGYGYEYGQDYGYQL